MGQRGRGISGNGADGTLGAACRISNAGASRPKALAFDVFGTVVDWRSGIACESAGFLASIARTDIDPGAFADGWLARYLSAMAAFGNSGRGIVVLDVLHREMLEGTLRTFDIAVGEREEALLVDWNRAWHRLDPWADSVAGLSWRKTECLLKKCLDANAAAAAIANAKGAVVATSTKSQGR